LGLLFLQYRLCYSETSRLLSLPIILRKSDSTAITICKYSNTCKRKLYWSLFHRWWVEVWCKTMTTFHFLLLHNKHIRLFIIWRNSPGRLTMTIAGYIYGVSHYHTRHAKRDLVSLSLRVGWRLPVQERKWWFENQQRCVQQYSYSTNASKPYGLLQNVNTSKQAIEIPWNKNVNVTTERRNYRCSWYGET